MSPLLRQVSMSWGRCGSSRKSLACRRAGENGYLGAMPRQDFPLATGQGNLLLDGTLKLICEKAEQRREGCRKGQAQSTEAKGSRLMAGRSVWPKGQPGGDLCGKFRGQCGLSLLVRAAQHSQRTARKRPF